MINKSNIKFTSDSGKLLNNMFINYSEGSSNIAIIFPGGDNCTDIPTLHYARKSALLCGCDVLSLEYGYDKLHQLEIAAKVVDESYDIIKKCLVREYNGIFFISKSIGHSISLKVDEKMKNKNIKHVCYTPLSINVDDIIKKECIVFTGTKDKWIKPEEREKLTKYQNVELIEIKNAVHSLEIDDSCIESIKILEYITGKCSEFITRNMVKI